jgi:hypothetical protein
LIVRQKVADFSRPAPYQILDRLCRAVPGVQPYDFRRMAPEKAALTEVGIFGDNRQPVRGSVIPNGNIIGIAQADVTNVQRVRKRSAND